MFGSIWLELCKSERIENVEMIEKWEDRKYLIFSLYIWLWVWKSEEMKIYLFGCEEK